MRIRFIMVMLLLTVFTGCTQETAVREASPTPDRSRPIAASDTFTVVAESEGITLSFKQSTCEIQVTDRDGIVWASTPEDYENDKLAKGQNKMTLASLLTATFLSRMGNEDTETAMAGSIRRGNYEAYQITNGVRVELNFPAKRTTVPVEIVLDKGTLLVSVYPDQIIESETAEDEEENSEDRGYRITGITLLPFFMSASGEDNGYLMVPDGSGALIYLNNGKSKSTYSQSIYGNDRNTPPVQKPGGVKDALLPVYGLYREGSGVLAVLEEGAALAQVQAAVGGDKTSYNTVYAGFNLRPPGSYSVTGIDGKSRSIKVTSSWITPMTALSIRYYFLGQGGDYSEMAAVYRRHLESSGFTRLTHEDGLPLVLDVYGSVTGEKSVMGLPMKIRTALTRFEDCTDMTDRLRSGGIEQLFVRYVNWLSGGSRHTAPSSFSPDGKLGGAKAFNDMAESFHQNGVALYPDMDITTAYRKPFLGLGRPIIRNVSNLPVEQYAFDLSVYTKTEQLQSRSWLFSPSTFIPAVTKFVNHKQAVNAQSYVNGYSLGTLGSAPYSDVGSAQLDRGLSEEMIYKASAVVRDTSGGLALSAPGAFLFPLTDLVMDTPESSSGYVIEDVSIPFYQMVLSGYAHYSLPAFNLAADTRMQLLKAAETGAYLQLSVIQENTALLKETPLEYLYSASFDEWAQLALEAVKELSEAYEAAQGTIRRHDILAPGVTRTEYESGKAVVVNYNPESYSANGISVAGLSFIVEGFR